MRWLGLAIVVLGCSTSQPPASPGEKLGIPRPAGTSSTGAPGEILTPALMVPPAPPPRSSIAENDPNKPQVQLPAPGALTTGIHSTAIVRIAATDDGTTVISADANEGLRLWPTLDGRRESVVIASTGPTRELSIEHAGKELMIARLDDTGTLELIRVSALGEPVTRATVVSERPLVQIRAIESGALAVRDDGILVNVDPAAHVTEQLSPDPGQRVVTVLYRNHHALAVMASATGLTGRWIELSPLGWGATTPRLAIDPTNAALSPDQRLIATTNVDRTTAVVIDLRTGKVIARPVEPDGDSHERGFERVWVVGFLDADTLAIGDEGTLAWWHDKELTSDESNVIFMHPIATDRHLISRSGMELALTTRQGTQYLGYHLSNPRTFLPVRGGVMIGSEHAVLRVDSRFAERVRYQLDPALSEFIPIDAHHVVATSSADRGVYCVDLEDPENPKLIASNGSARYQPSTRILAIEQAKAVVFARYDPQVGAFDEPTWLAVIDEPGTTWKTFELLDPVVSGGRVAMLLRGNFDGESFAITEMIEILSVRAKAEPVVRSRTFPSGGDVSTQVGRGDLSAFGISLTARRKSPDGQHIVELGRERITLRRSTGEQVWVIPARGIRDVVWSAQGELMAFDGGAAVLDLATGAFARRRCGWDFGLWQDASRESVSGSALCAL